MNVKDILIVAGVTASMVSLLLGGFGFGASYGWRQGFETGVSIKSQNIDSFKNE